MALAPPQRDSLDDETAVVARLALREEVVGSGRVVDHAEVDAAARRGVVGRKIGADVLEGEDLAAQVVHDGAVLHLEARAVAEAELALRVEVLVVGDDGGAAVADDLREPVRAGRRRGLAELGHGDAVLGRGIAGAPEGGEGERDAGEDDDGAGDDRESHGESSFPAGSGAATATGRLLPHDAPSDEAPIPTGALPFRTIPRDLGDVRIEDLRTILLVERSGSLAGAARQLGGSTSGVSKTIARLEKRLGHPLLTRSSRGVELTEAGHRLVPEISALLEKFGRLVNPESEQGIDLTLAAQPYLLAMFQPAIAASHEGLRVRGIALSPALTRARLSAGTFDAALLTDAAGDLPASWALESIGRMRKGLFTTPGTAARLGGSTVTERALAGETFVTPSYADAFGASSDDCPLPLVERRIGHQTDAMSVALDVAARTGQLVFGPALSAREHIACGALVELHVAGWDVRPELYLLVHVDRVRATVRRAIAQELARAVGGDRHGTATPRP